MLKRSLVVLLLAGSACGAASGTNGGTAASSPSAAASSAPAAKVANACGYLLDSEVAVLYSGGSIKSEAETGRCAYSIVSAGGTFNVCNITTSSNSGAKGSYDSYKSAAANYGPVSDAGVGDASFVSTQPSGEKAALDIGMMKGGTFVDLICAGAATADAKVTAIDLGKKIAARI